MNQNKGDMQIDFEKGNGLVPCIIQDLRTKQVLMLGYMNQEAWEQTQSSGKVTFWSRSKERLWTKGETSQNYLYYHSHQIDCDVDTLLIWVTPAGPACHTGATTCFDNDGQTHPFSIHQLEQIIEERASADPNESYTASLLAKGINKVAQKVGEEAVEIVIEAKDDHDELFLGEAADLMYHFLVLLKAKNKTLGDVERVLEKRHRK